MPKFCVTIGEQRLYYCDVVIEASSAAAAKAKVEMAIEDDLLDFPTGRGYATSDKSIVCIDHRLDCTTHIEALEVAVKYGRWGAHAPADGAAAVEPVRHYSDTE